MKISPSSSLPFDYYDGLFFFFLKGNSTIKLPSNGEKYKLASAETSKASIGKTELTIVIKE